MGILNPSARTKNLKFAAFLGVLLACSAPEAAPRGGGLPLDRIRLPAGFSIAVFSDQVPGARSMTLSPKGILYVGTRGPGKVYAVLDRDKDGKADEVQTIASG